jgi:hypothetical protein
VLLFAESIQVPWHELPKEARGDTAFDPATPLLNAHKQFMLLRKLVNIKATCSTENF